MSMNSDREEAGMRRILYITVISFVFLSIWSIPSHSSSPQFVVEGGLQSIIEYNSVRKEMNITSPLELYLRLYDEKDMLLEIALLPEEFDLLYPASSIGAPRITLARVVARGSYFKGESEVVTTFGDIRVDGNLINPYGVNGKGIKIEGVRLGEAVGKAYILFTPWGSKEYIIDISDFIPPVTCDFSFARSSSGDLIYGADGTIAIGKYSAVRGGYRNILGNEDYHIDIESWFIPFSGVGLGYSRLPDGKEGVYSWIQTYLSNGTVLGLNYDKISGVVQGSASRIIGPYHLRSIVEPDLLFLQASRDYKVRKDIILSVDAGADLEKNRVIPNMGLRLDSSFDLGLLKDIKAYASYSFSRYGQYLYIAGDYIAPNGIRGVITYFAGNRNKEFESVLLGLTVTIVKAIEF